MPESERTTDMAFAFKEPHLAVGSVPGGSTRNGTLSLFLSAFQHSEKHYMG